MTRAMKSLIHSTVQIDGGCEIGKSKGGLLITVLVCLVLAFLAFWAACLALVGNDQNMQAAFAALAIEGAFFALVIFIKYGKSGIYCFEPFTMVTLVMVLVYFIAPLFQFAAGSTTRYGVDVSGNCLQGTLYVMIGYFAFFLLYEHGLWRKDRRRECPPSYLQIKEPDVGKLLRWAYAMWFLAYCLNIFYYKIKGFDLVYIITGGLTGGETNDLVEDSLAFLAYMKFIMLGSWMMIYAYGANRLVKGVTFVLMLLCMFLGGGRATLMIGILAPIVFSFARRKKSPKFSSVAISCGALVLLFAFMQVARVGLRTGVGLDMSGITLDELFNPFYAEIDDFKAFYVLFDVVPEKHGFLLGSEMIIYSLVFLIPRAIFPGKPEPAVHDIIALGLGNQAAINGVAYPAIGEYYIEFGLFGVVVCMAIFGSVCRHLKKCYLANENKSLALMAYSVIYPSLMTFVIRGYFPQVFSMTLFMLGPLFVFWVLLKSSHKEISPKLIDSERRAKWAKS